MDLLTNAFRLLPMPLQLHFDKLMASDIGSRMARGAFWSIGGAIISRVFMLGAFVLVARLLGQEGYGEFGMIRTTLTTFLAFAGFGLGMTATKHVAEFRVSDPQRAGRIMAISAVFAICTGTLTASCLYFFAASIAEHTINAPHLASYLQISAFVLFLSALNGAQTGALAGLEAFKSIAKVNSFVGLVSFPILVAGAYFGGLRGAVWALFINMGINWLLNHLMLRHETARHNIPLSFNGCFSEGMILWRFSLPAALGGLMVSPVLWLGSAMLVRQPNGYGNMGIYDAVSQWQATIQFVPNILGQIALPLLANLTGEEKNKKFLTTLKYNALFNGGVALAVALPVALSAKYILRFYGEGFEDGWVALSIIAASTVLISLNRVVGQAIASRGRMWIGLWFNAMWAVVFLSTCWLLIYNGYGVTGLALANLIAYFFHTAIQSIYIRKLITCPLAS